MASYFNWTDANKYEFAALVHKEHGHMKTEETYNVKWEKILNKLKEKSNFSELSIKAPALRNTFERFKDAVLKECGISEEGANLSGLKAEASAYVQLIVSMAEEEHKRAYQAERKDKKKKTIQKGLLTHEVLALTTQGKPFINLDDPITKSDASEMDSSSPSSSTSSITVPADNSSQTTVDKKKKPSQPKVGKTIVDKFTEAMTSIAQDDESTLQLENQAKEMELRYKEQEFQDRQEEKRRRLELEERSMALQERQLAVMEALLNRK